MYDERNLETFLQISKVENGYLISEKLKNTRLGETDRHWVSTSDIETANIIRRHFEAGDK